MSAFVDAAPVVAVVAPLVNAAVSSLVVGIIGLGFAALAKYTGLIFPTDFQAELAKKADGVVQAEVAKAEDGFSKQRIDVGHPVAAAAEAALVAEAPELIAKLGLTPAAVSALVLGAVGRAQIAMSH